MVCVRLKSGTGATPSGFGHWTTVRGAPRRSCREYPTSRVDTSGGRTMRSPGSMAKGVECIEERNRIILQIAYLVVNLKRRGMKKQMFFKEKRTAVTGSLQRNGGIPGYSCYRPVEPPEVPMVWNGAAESFRTAGSNTGKAFIDPGASGVFEAIPQAE